MADELNSLPVPSGEQIETLKLDGGLHVPSSLLGALLPGGALQYLRALADGSVQTEGGARAVASATIPGSRVAVGVTSGVLVAANADRRYLSLVNKEGPGEVWVSWGAAAVVNAGLWLPLDGSWEMPPNVRFTGEVRAIATIADTHVAVSEF